MNAAGAREILPEEMRGAGLDGFPVLRQCFDAKGLDRPRETFAFRFLAAHDRDGEVIANKRFVNVEHLFRFRARFGFGFVDSVSFLPKELGRPQKNARPHLPADDVAPLIDQNRQIAIALDPLRVARADDRFRSRPNDQWLGERTRRNKFAFGVRLEPAVSNNRAFLCETLNMFGFLREITQRNEEREIGVAMAGGAKHRVEMMLHVFPDAVAPRANDHATADIGRFRHRGGPDHLLIPFGKIFVAPRRDRGLGGSWSLLGHEKAAKLRLAK